MAWTGVPFTSASAFRGYNWSNEAFLNQFIEAMEMRFRALHELSGLTLPTLERITPGANIQSAPQWNRLRGGAGYRHNLAGDRSAHAADMPSPNDIPPLFAALVGGGAGHYWIDPGGIGMGEVLAVEDFSGSDIPAIPPDNIRYFVPASTPSGTVWKCTQLFVDKVNAQLVANGCPEMGPAPLDVEYANRGYDAGIPWTRLIGDAAAPTVEFGLMQDGDIIARHIFNEWQAVIQVLTCVWGASAENGSSDLDNGSFREVDIYSVSESNTEADGNPCAYMMANLSLSSAGPQMGIWENMEISGIRSTFQPIVEPDPDPPEPLRYNLSAEYSAWKNTIKFAAPILTHGQTFYLFAISKAQANTTTWPFTPFDGITAVEGEVTHLQTGACDGTTLTLEVGTLSQELGQVGCTVAAEGQTEVSRGSQGYLCGLTAVLFSFPDP